jgi:hypothetical protein
MVDRLLLKMPVRLGPMANGVASPANALKSRRGDRSTRCVRARVLTRRIQIAAEDSRLYTRTDRWDEAGSGNLSELASDVSEKEGQFRLFSSSLFQVSSKRF